MSEHMPIPFVNAKRIATNIDVAKLMHNLVNNQHLWQEIKVRQTYKGTAHKDTETIFLRWCQSLETFQAFNDLIAVDYPAMDKLKNARDAVSTVASLVDATVTGRAIITKLLSGGEIAEHSDMGLYADIYERFHLVLKADKGNTFKVGGECFEMCPGELWVINHKANHSVTNKSATDRIHLIVDAIAPKYRKERTNDI